jgi:hypothetical protein
MASKIGITAETPCEGCDGSRVGLTKPEIDSYRPLVPDWVVNDDYTRLRKEVKVRNFSVRRRDLCEQLIERLVVRNSSELKRILRLVKDLQRQR